jgi:8-oxo-dGTP pyrophosphatase MutT (NUDIX family)
MSFPFGQATCQLIAQRCAVFARQPTPKNACGLKRAAVAITLVKADLTGDSAFVLTRRASGLRAHGGQWALPGGRCDGGETPIEAALRELKEELKLALDAASVLGQLDDYPTRSGYLITPVVLWAGADAVLDPNLDEVASVHRIPLSEIVHEQAVSFITIPESKRRVIRFQIEGRFIHAPTAAIIYQFRELIAGRITRVAELEQPVFAWR